MRVVAATGFRKATSLFSVSVTLPEPAYVEYVKPRLQNEEDYEVPEAGEFASGLKMMVSGVVPLADLDERMEKNFQVSFKS